MVFIWRDLATAYRVTKVIKTSVEVDWIIIETDLRENALNFRFQLQ